MISLSRQFRHSTLGLSVISLAFSCSACMNLPQTARMNTPANGPVQALYKEASKPAPGSKGARKNRDTEIQQLGSSQPGEGVTRVHHDSAIQQMAYAEDAEPGATPARSEGEINTAAHTANPVQTASGIQTASGFHHRQQFVQGQPVITSCPPAGPRWPAAGPDPLAPGMMACDVCNLPSPEKYDDEYLCDGGDRDIPVHYDEYNRVSLDTEDTIVEYTDRMGREKLRPSNRVCVYAPRFSSVRTVTRPHEDYGANEVAGVGQLARTGGMSSRLKASKGVQRTMLGGIAVRSRAGGLDMEEGQGTVAQLRSPSTHDKLLNIYEALTFVRFGRVDDADSARLNYGIQAASVWTRTTFPVITAKTDMVLEGHFSQSAVDLTVVDDKNKKPEDLRIVKLADKKTARPGDEIEFTIRYDNLGDDEAFHIRIVDNLTPRLDYINDSATSDRAGRLVLQDNGEGSQILVWELDEPLPGKTGGTVTFKARVR